MNEQIIQRLCVIGVGLIGGSLSRALKKNHAVTEIVGVGRNKQHLQKALNLGVIDRYECDIAAGVSGCDMIVLAVPLGSMQQIFEKIAPAVDKHAVITDVGSVKASVVNAAISAFGNVPANLIPAHPIAGTEQRGVEASFAELFQQRQVVITPLENSAANALTKVRNMWQACGAEIVETSVERHDELLAATSHLPQVLAYSLLNTLAKLNDDDGKVFDFAGSGFCDFSRIASSDPQMWHDICLANSDALLAIINGFSHDLQQLARAIKNKDSDYLQTTFSRAKNARDAFCHNHINEPTE